MSLSGHFGAVLSVTFQKLRTFFHVYFLENVYLPGLRLTLIGQPIVRSDWSIGT